jgi:hypothetical protein
MARMPSLFLSSVSLVALLTGCVTVACDPDDPKTGKDCYECGRKARIDAGQDDPSSRVLKERTEDCLRERGYLKQKKEG